MIVTDFLIIITHKTYLILYFEIQMKRQHTQTSVN